MPAVASDRWRRPAARARGAAVSAGACTSLRCLFRRGSSASTGGDTEARSEQQAKGSVDHLEHQADEAQKDRPEAHDPPARARGERPEEPNVAEEDREEREEEAVGGRQEQGDDG